LGFEVEDFRAWAKVPILMLQKDGLDIDLSCYNLLPLLNTRLLRSYTLLNPRPSVVVVAVKRWAKAHRIAKARDGFISSYAWTLMVIY
jgi:terminal uridylyltransferase